MEALEMFEALWYDRERGLTSVKANGEQSPIQTEFGSVGLYPLFGVTRDQCTRNRASYQSSLPRTPRSSFLACSLVRRPCLEGLPEVPIASTVGSGCVTPCSAAGGPLVAARFTPCDCRCQQSQPHSVTERKRPTWNCTSMLILLWGRLWSHVF